MYEVKRGTASRVISALVAVVAVLLVVVACGGSSTTSTGSSTTASAGAGSAAAPGTASNSIVIKNFAFMPAEVTVAPGAKIMVMNQDSVVHTVTASDKTFDSGNVAPGQMVEFTAPTTPGSFAFRCTPHQYMMGMLTVK